MKIGVVGCGAVGSYYGGRLAHAGHQTHFLLRSDYEVVSKSGVKVRSVAGDFHVRPIPARTPAEIGACDVVVVALKTTANDQFPVLLPPLVGPATKVLTLQNGLGNEEQLAACLGAERVFGGLCFVCLNRLEPGLIEHSAHGLVRIGEHLRPAGREAASLVELFESAQVPCRIVENLEAVHWEKLMWNIPFNGLGVAGAAGYEALEGGPLPIRSPRGRCLPTDALLGDPRWARWIEALMDEVMAIAEAQGHKLAPHLKLEMLERTRVMGAYRASTLIDFERGLALETESLFGEPARRARAVGVVTPRLDALLRVLRALDRPPQVEERR